MRYYIYMIDGVAGSLRRVDMNSSPIILERWDGKKWVFSPETIAITGFASDADNYKEITKRVAEEYIIENQKPTMGL